MCKHTIIGLEKKSSPENSVKLNYLCTMLKKIFPRGLRPLGNWFPHHLGAFLFLVCWQPWLPTNQEEQHITQVVGLYGYTFLITMLQNESTQLQDV